jgi:hypothetical protein
MLDFVTTTTTTTTATTTSSTNLLVRGLSLQILFVLGVIAGS